MGEYTESLSNSSDAGEAGDVFLDGSEDVVLPERLQWSPDMLSGFAADKLLMPLGGLGTDKWAAVPPSCAVSDVGAWNPGITVTLARPF